MAAIQFSPPHVSVGCHLAADPDCELEEALNYGQEVCSACRSFGASTHALGPSRSAGHVAFVGEVEFFTVGREVYRAPKRNPLDVRGYRQGARFECYLHSLETALRLARGDA
jgi:hypothetical protein